MRKRQSCEVDERSSASLLILMLRARDSILSTPIETIGFWQQTAKEERKTSHEKLGYALLVALVSLHAPRDPRPPELPISAKTREAVFEAKCSLCHGIDRPLEKNKTPANGRDGDRMQKAPDKISMPMLSCCSLSECGPRPKKSDVEF